MPPSEHGNRCRLRVEPQKEWKSLTSMTGIFLLRPAPFDELCIQRCRNVLHEFLTLAFASVRLPCYDVGLPAVDVWRYDAVEVRDPSG